MQILAGSSFDCGVFYIYSAPQCNENHMFFSGDFLIGNSAKLPQRFDENPVIMHKKIRILHARALPFFLSDRFVMQT